MNTTDFKYKAKVVLGMTKINFRLNIIPYIITGIAFLAIFSGYIISMAIPPAEADMGDNFVISFGNILFLFPITLAIFIPALNFSKFLNLGAKRMDLFRSSIFAYIPAIILTALMSLIIHLTEKVWMAGRIDGSWDLFYLFNSNKAVAFFQIFAFMTFATCVVHSVTLIQGRWYGWLVDAFIVFWFILFPSIPIFRPIVTWFYNLIMFNRYAVLQIFSCLVLGTGIYCLSLFPIKKKRI